jgi:hypothetical protein
MCSTPRPKKKVKGKSGSSGGVLSNMNPDARRRFAERANIAQERRHKIMMEEQQKKRLDNPVRLDKKVKNFSDRNMRNSLSYWLLNASMKDILILLFLSTPKRT